MTTTHDYPDALERIATYVADVRARCARGQVSDFDALQRVANYAADVAAAEFAQGVK